MNKNKIKYFKKYLIDYSLNNQSDKDYKSLYYKYKSKYLNLVKQLGGNTLDEDIETYKLLADEGSHHHQEVYQTLVRIKDTNEIDLLRAICQTLSISMEDYQLIKGHCDEKIAILASSSDPVSGSGSNSAPPELAQFGDGIRTNIDDGLAHIRPAVQNIVLRFGELTDFMVPEGQYIAGLVSRQDVGSQSGTWCPLIWRALARCYNDIPEELTREYQADVDQLVGGYSFDDLVIQLSEIPKWCQYARIVLTTNFGAIPNDSRNFDSDFVVYHSNRIAESL